MSKLTQGTQIYVIDPDTEALVEVDCVTNFNPGGNPADQLDDTCLADTTASFKPGLRKPGQASLSIRPDPANTSHIKMHQWSETDPSPVLKWAVGWSDGIGIDPTVDSNGNFNLPTTRTWFTFSGYIADFPFDFAQNTLVESAVSIQRSGGSSWVKKV
jgi:hypothetical protein